MRELTERDFDGHPEINLRDMTPKEKLQYLSEQIEIVTHITKNIVRKSASTESSYEKIR